MAIRSGEPNINVIVVKVFILLSGVCKHDQIDLNGLCCGVGQVNSNGLCCGVGQINSNGLCCNVGQVNSNGLCCGVGQVNSNGLCCGVGHVNFNGLCAEKCPNSHINVDGICSKCENNQVPNSKQTACICPRSHFLENNKCQLICKDGKIPNTDFGTNRASGTGGTIAPCICPKGQAYLDFTFVVLGQLIEKFKCQDCPRGEIPNKDQTDCVTPNIKDPINKGKF